MSGSSCVYLKSIKMIAFTLLFIIFFLDSTAINAATLPKRPYIDWWGNAKTLKYLTIVTATPKTDIEFWRNRDVLSSGFVGLSNEDQGYIKTGDKKGLRVELERRVADGYKSIALEVERNTDSDDARVLKEFKIAHPDIFVTAWMLGLDNRHPYDELEEVIDLFINEVYTDYGHKLDRFKKFIELAKREGIIEKSIFAISVENTTLNDTEEQLELVRTIAPEMPGIALFLYQGIPKDKEIDALMAKYFVDPLITIPSGSLQVSINDPKVNQRVDLSVKVANIGYTEGEVSVDIYDGDPDKKGKLLYSRAGRSLLKGQEEKKIDFSLRFSKGVHQVFVTLHDGKSSSLKGKKQATAEIITREKKWWEYITNLLG